jgi:hypothetical protein
MLYCEIDSMKSMFQAERSIFYQIDLHFGNAFDICSYSLPDFLSVPRNYAFMLLQEQRAVNGPS